MALQHPVRRELLRLANEHGEISVRQGAKHLRESLGTVRYHVNVLVDAQALRPSEPRLEKGSWTKFWRTTEVLDQTGWVQDVLASRPLP
jgi:predicted ArsR family transcriptional regulator